MGLIGAVVGFVIFVVCVVIVILVIQWAVKKVGWTVDPALMTILYLIIFVVLLLLFLDFSGIWVWSGHLGRN